MSFENVVGKGEIAYDKQFVLSPQTFSTLQQLSLGLTRSGPGQHNDYFLDSALLKNFISRSHVDITGQKNENEEIEFVMHDKGLNGTFVNDVRAGVDSDSLIVAAIDFGTTYSGVAFSFKHEFKDNPRKVNAMQWSGGQLMTLKGPTSVLITGDGGEVDSFGYDAETKYAEFADEETNTEWYFFRRFKMMLHGEKTLEHGLMLEDVTGKKLSALKVFSLSLKYLKDYPRKTGENQILDTVSEDDIHWVLTVPAIWNDTAKQFMRKAAEMAGIDGSRLTIALEPEAASLYCRHIPFEKSKGEQKSSLSQFKSGTKYLVLDAGGGTVDITVHEITFKGDIKELHHASGGAWGGTKVDDAFEGFLKELFGNVGDFKRDKFADYIDLFLDFEIKKRKLPSSGNVTIKVPGSLNSNLKRTIASSRYSDKIKVVSDKMRIDVDIIKDLVLPTVNKIVRHVKDLLRLPTVRGCSAIVMVGGFSECQLLQDKIREAFPSMKVIIPEDAGLAVLKGAVIFGHTPTAIAERVCKYTYGDTITHLKREICDHPPGKTYVDENGDERCDDIFQIHVRKGQSVKLGQKQTELIGSPIYDNQTEVTIQIYASTEGHPNFVTDEGCQKIGRFNVPVTGGCKGEFGTTFMFGGTEIEVICEDKRTGKETRRRFDFLG